MHALELGVTWRLTRCHGLHLGGMVYCQFSTVRANGHRHANVQRLKENYTGVCRPSSRLHKHRDRLQLHHIPRYGVTQFTIRCYNMDAHLGNNKKYKKRKKKNETQTKTSSATK